MAGSMRVTTDRFEMAAIAIGRRFFRTIFHVGKSSRRPCPPGLRERRGVRLDISTVASRARGVFTTASG
jgi:hypothetical protein